MWDRDLYEARVAVLTPRTPPGCLVDHLGMVGLESGWVGHTSDKHHSKDSASHGDTY